MNKIFRFPSGLRLAYKYSSAVRSVGIAVYDGSRQRQRDGAKQWYFTLYRAYVFPREQRTNLL